MSLKKVRGQWVVWGKKKKKKDLWRACGDCRFGNSIKCYITTRRAHEDIFAKKKKTRTRRKKLDAMLQITIVNVDSVWTLHADVPFAEIPFTQNFT